MEDPWASGPAWSGEPGSVVKTPTPPSSPPLAATPPRNLDVSDPWGAPTAAISDGSIITTGHDWSGDSVQQREQDGETAETPGWGGGWDQERGLAEEEEPVAGPSRSPVRKPQESPNWGISKSMERYSSSSPGVDPADDVDLASPPTSSPRPLEPQPGPPLSPPAAPPIDLSSAKLPHSPSYGDEFGGFSSGFGDDPWGTKKEDTGWAQGSARASSDAGQSRRSSIGSQNREADDGWGGPAAQIEGRVHTPQKSGMDQDWEEAQLRIRVTEQRAPREKIELLQNSWRDLIVSLAGDGKLEASTDAKGDELDDRLRRQAEQVLETLRSLATLPPEINTYPPVLSSFETYERYQYALKRPNTVLETSLLNMPMGRRSRRQESALDNLDSWTSRSRLGEPEAPQLDSRTQTEEAKSKWSFWRKSTAEKPLVTSGGGILEVKSSASPTPTVHTSAPLESRPSIGSANSKPSRPTSPAPSSFSTIDISSTAPSTAAVSSPPPPNPAGPSAVSRFFGRLSRRQTSQSIPGIDKGDMEFSADDFSFLDQVPSMSSPDQEKMVGDLLSMEGGRTEEMASLESMIRSKPTALPAPLAPPPMTSRTPSSSRVPSYAPNRDMDLLSGLDFYGPDSNNAATESAAAKPQLSEWDYLLSIPRTATTPTLSSPGPSRPPIPKAIPPQPDILPPRSMPTIPAVMHPALQPTSQPNPLSDFEDFTDFTAPSAVPNQVTPASEIFDDFGDFEDSATATSAFQTLPQLHSPPANSESIAASRLQAPTIPSHAKRASLDHSLTLNLMNDASTSKGQRWPAPPSPVPPSLEPPPKVSNTGNSNASFPFLAPPPGSARPSKPVGLGDLMNDDDFGGSSAANLDSSTGTATPPARISSPPIAPSMTMQPMRTASPIISPSTSHISRPASAAPTHKPDQAHAQQSQAGLSAQDLSFFDSL